MKGSNNSLLCVGSLQLFIDLLFQVMLYCMFYIHVHKAVPSWGVINLPPPPPPPPVKNACLVCIRTADCLSIGLHALVHRSCVPHSQSEYHEQVRLPPSRAPPLTHKTVRRRNNGCIILITTRWFPIFNV